MTNEQVAAVLDEVGTLLEIQGQNPFRSQAYHRASRAVEQLEASLAALVESGQLSQLPGIGKTMAEAITSLVRTGTLPYHEELRAQTPPGLFEMLRLPGMGPKKVKALYSELGVQDLVTLKDACQNGRVAALKGFGTKTQEKLLQGIEFLGQVGQRFRIDQVEELARGMVERLRQCRGVACIEVCGSLRRRKETINDLDLLVGSDSPEPIMDCFVGAPGVVQILGRGETKCSVSLQTTTSSGRQLLVNADLRVVSAGQFPFALHYFTGNKDHNIAMRARAQQRGLKLNEYELVGPDRKPCCQNEAELFAALDLAYIPPELREHTGEMEAAALGRLPRLLELADLRGVFHCHSDWSDGGATLEEMARAAQVLGYEYLGIADHSQSLTVARGLTPERVRKQHIEIDALNARFRGFRLFKGTECDILADGSLDFDDAVLDTFDYVVASVHSHFGQSPEDITARIVRAVSNPRVTMLGHATGRLLLRRPGYPVNLEAVLQAAARTGTMIEINAQPSRLDIDWIHVKRARAVGVRLVINPDAHSTGEIAYVRYGVDVARRGWLEKADVFNTLPIAQVSQALEERKGVRS